MIAVREAPVPACEHPPVSSVRRVFRDDVNEQRFQSEGYAIVPFLAPAVAERLRAAFEALGPPHDRRAYQHELWGHDRARKDLVADLIAPDVSPALDRVLVDYVARTRAFIRKGVGPDTVVPPHVDISFVDESRWRSVMVWCSLDGHGPGDGILHLVPGSQRLRPGVRAHCDNASTFPDLVSDVVDTWGVAAPVPLGHAVIFDHGIVHYAEPNRGPHDRLTLQCVCAPAESQLLYPTPAGPGRARVHAVDEAFYRAFSLNETPDRELLDRYPVIDEVAVPTERLARSDFDSVRPGSR